MHGKHTQGPWSIGSEVLHNDNTVSFEVGTTNGWPYFVWRPFNGVGDLGYHPAIGIQDIDDAKLIAAAPEMLEALQTLLAWIDGQVKNGTYPHKVDFPAARAVIAKATE